MKKFEDLFSRLLNCLSSYKSQKARKKEGDKVFRRGNEGGGLEDVLTLEANKKKNDTISLSGNYVDLCVSCLPKHVSMLIR